MVRYGRLKYEIEIPDEVTATVDGSKVKIEGPLGKIERNFDHTGVKINHEGDSIFLTVLFPRKKEKALIGTVRAHINNAILGVQFGYRYYMKIVFSHFPIRVKTEGDKVIIENLYGGRKPLKADVLPTVKVRVDGEDIIVEGPDKDAVGQTCANIQEITRQRGSRRKSPKTFMDGIYTYDKEFQEEPPMDVSV